MVITIVGLMVPCHHSGADSPPVTLCQGGREGADCRPRGLVKSGKESFQRMDISDSFFLIVIMLCLLSFNKC